MRLFFLFIAALVSQAAHAQPVAGPKLGPVTRHTASIWVQGDKPARVALEVTEPGSAKPAWTTAASSLSRENDFTARFDLDQLASASRYQYRLVWDGVVLEPAYRFATLAGQTAGYKVYLGSCAHLLDPATDSGKPGSGSFEIFDRIASEAAADAQPHLMLWLCDNIYLDVCKEKYEKVIIPKLPSKANTPLKLEMNGGNFIAMPAARIIEMTTNGINLLTRQAFVMFYGSFETYLFQLFEISFPLVGVTENLLDKSHDLLMLKKWDGKFCKMNEVFGINYMADDLINHFQSFEMDFEGKKHKNPLTFLDDIAQVRHRILHASSLLEYDKLIFIDMNIFHGFFGSFFLLTDYVDNLFASKFGYTRRTTNPAEA